VPPPQVSSMDIATPIRWNRTNRASRKMRRRILQLTSLALLLAVRSFCGPVIAQNATDSPELAEASNLSKQVAALYGQREYSEALPLARRVIALREKALGRDHELVAIALHNLGQIYFALTRYSDAEDAYSTSLAIREKKLGDASPSLCMTLEALALTRFARRNNSAAEKLYLRSLAIKEKTYGAGHWETGQTLERIGYFFERTEKHQKALDYYRQSLAIMEKNFGPTNPEVAPLLYSCACELIATNKPAEAKEYQDRADKITKEILALKKGRVLQGSAILKVEPAPPRSNARGSVVVEVTVDQCGRVVDARAIIGPADLRGPAVEAAKQWRFTPTRLEGRPVKVIGSITFNFK